jgi:hypothetical protein
MIPIPDLVALAGARNAKMVLAGDTGQLQAVENGGAMSLLAVALDTCCSPIARHPPHLAALITAGATNSQARADGPGFPSHKSRLTYHLCRDSRHGGAKGAGGGL